MDTCNWQKLFEEMHPDFFGRPYIRDIPESLLYEEMILDLHALRDIPPVPVPEGVEYREVTAAIPGLSEAIRSVEPDWVPIYRPDSRVFCGLAGEQIASFCMISGMGTHAGLRIGGPGCVGTVPEFRRQGIGLEMVRQVTLILKKEGCDLSWIHYTGVAPWYAKLGYQTVLRWNCHGFLPPSRDQR